MEQQTAGNKEKQGHSDLAEDCKKQAHRVIEKRAALHKIEGKSPMLRMVENHKHNGDDPQYFKIQTFFFHGLTSESKTE